MPISLTMIRLLLSLLALVSGLGVQVAPAQARLCETEIGAPAPARPALQIAVRVADLSMEHRATPARTLGPARQRPGAQTRARPGVLIGIDRAHA